MKANDAYAVYLQDKSEENYDQLGKALLKYIRAIIAREFGNRFHDLEDSVGDVVLKILAGLPQFQEKQQEAENFAKWVYGITYNTSIDRLTEKSRLREQRLLDIEPMKENLSRINKIILHSFIDKMPKEDRELVAKLRAGYSLAEIAENLQEKEATLRKRWERVLDRLRTLGVGLAKR